MRLIKLMLIVTMFATVGVSSVYAQKEGKIGFVDLSRLFDEYHRTVEYDKKLEEESKVFEAERNKMLDKIKEAQGKLSLLKDEEKVKVEAEVEKLKNDLLEFDRQKKADITKDRNDKIREILLEIEKVVSDYAKRENFNIILNDRVLIYGQQAYNLTDKILSELNESKRK